MVSFFSEVVWSPLNMVEATCNYDGQDILLYALLVGPVMFIIYKAV